MKYAPDLAVVCLCLSLRRAVTYTESYADQAATNRSTIDVTTVQPDATETKSASSAERVPLEDISQESTASPVKSQERLLFKFLLDGYEPLVRPAMNASATVIVRVGVSLAQLLDVDEKTQIMTTLIWLRQEWVDERLQWDPDHFFGIKRVYVPSSLVWVPDIVLYNTMEITTTTLAKSRVVLNYDGSIYWKPMVKFSSACRIDITYFPFDDQICWLKMGSWSYDGFQVDVEILSSVVSTDGYAPNDDFDLVNTALTRQVSLYGCCPEPFPDVVAHLHLRRRTLYYVFNILAPCSMLSFISLLSFLLPPNFREQKIMIQLSILLSFSFFKLVVVEVTPRTSDAVPLIGTYLTALMALIAMSTIAHMVAAHIILAEGITLRFSHRCLKASYVLSSAIKSVVFLRKLRTRKAATNTANSCRLATTEEVDLEDDEAHDKTAPIVQLRPKSDRHCEETKEEQLVEKALSMLKSHQQAVSEKRFHEARWLKVTAMVDKAFFCAYFFAVFGVTLSTFIIKPMQTKLPST